MGGGGADTGGGVDSGGGGESNADWQRAGSAGFASEQRGNNLKGLEDF